MKPIFKCYYMKSFYLVSGRIVSASARMNFLVSVPFFPHRNTFFYILTVFFINVWALYNPWAKAHFSLSFMYCTCTPWPTKSPSTHSSSAICTLMQSLTTVITHLCIPESANRNHTGNILDDCFHSVQNVTRMT